MEYENQKNIVTGIAMFWNSSVLFSFIITIWNEKTKIIYIYMLLFLIIIFSSSLHLKVNG
jgi:hypothetical protein